MRPWQASRRQQTADIGPATETAQEGAPEEVQAEAGCEQWLKPEIGKMQTGTLGGTA